MIVAVDVRTFVGEAALLAGSLLIVLAAIGVVRFPDPLTRIHALAKASTAGVTLALVGVALTMSRVNDVMSLLFAAALQAATNPVASTLLARAIYDAEGIPSDVDRLDELDVDADG